MFIAFEGLDGSGSSTQVKEIADLLEKTGHPTLITKEPTSTNPIGRMIREILQHKWQASPEALQLLFAADRAEHLHTEIGPALNEGKIVLSDRYFFSTVAFGSLSVKDTGWLKQLNRLFPMPDLTFLLKLDPTECIKRIQKRGSPLELFEQEEKLKVIWETYHQLSKEYPNVHVIDAQKSIDAIRNEIWKIVEKGLRTKN